jgi:hypothetical protein
MLEIPFRNSLKTFIALTLLIASTVHTKNHITILAGPSIATMTGNHIEKSGTREWGFAYINVSKRKRIYFD